MAASASQVGSSQSVKCSTFIRGYHAYMDIWTPIEDEMLRLIPEPINFVDRNAVAVMNRPYSLQLGYTLCLSILWTEALY